MNYPQDKPEENYSDVEAAVATPGKKSLDSSVQESTPQEKINLLDIINSKIEASKEAATSLARESQAQDNVAKELEVFRDGLYSSKEGLLIPQNGTTKTENKKSKKTSPEYLANLRDFATRFQEIRGAYERIYTAEKAVEIFKKWFPIALEKIEEFQRYQAEGLYK